MYSQICHLSRHLSRNLSPPFVVGVDSLMWTCIYFILGNGLKQVSSEMKNNYVNITIDVFIGGVYSEGDVVMAKENSLI